jgi:pSer/pThr/pTyr-binding forkhead associated (FHA) protein
MNSGILDDGTLATVLDAAPAIRRPGGDLPRAGFEAMDEFLSSCGADGPLRLDVTGPAPRQAVRCVFEQPCVMIGRDLGNDLRLDHDQVSRRHAYLQVLSGRTFCVDLGSRTGLWWGKRTRNCGWLESPMYIGSYRLQRADRAASLFHPGPEWNPLETPAPDQRTLPRVTLEVFDAPQPTLHVIDRVLTLTGRSTACKLQVGSFSLSRFHCSFLLTKAGLWVIDLLSREGTTVNGKRVKWACLRPGDQLELGKILVRPNYDGPAPEGPATSAPATNGDQFHSPPASDPELPPFTPPRRRPDDQATRTLVALASALQPAAPPELPALDTSALEAAGPQGALLLPVLQQFGMMQQQMMDQFQQSMQMVVQVFASMHRDQMETLQKELDHVHRITRELNELQAELRHNQRGPIRARNGPLTRPAAAPAPLVAPSAPQAQALPPASTPAQPRPAAAIPGPAAPVPPGGAMPDLGDMHDWVNQRIVTLQKERESSWQKILGFVMGK